MTAAGAATTHAPGPHTAPRPGPPLAVLLNVSADTRAALERALCDCGLKVVERPCVDERVQRAAVVVIEGGRGPRSLDEARVLRRRGGGPIVLGVVGWWSENEPDVRRVTDAVLHMPLRVQQIHAVLAAFPGRLGHLIAEPSPSQS